MTKTNITPELIRAALAHIPAGLPRDEWARVAMAIKSEFPDATGFDLFTDWSASAQDHDPKATRSTWRSVKAGGGVGIGTLLHLAKEHGFTLPKTDQAPTPPSPEVLARRERDRKAAQATERARIDADHAHAASEAAAMWSAASETGSSPYLERKGVQSYGVRFAPDGWLLVPLRDATGTLLNLQRIAPEKPANGGLDKLFLKGGRKRGLLHWLGALPSSGDDAPAPAVILICEGYATGASLHQATGRPVAVAFDAGNLVHVAKALRAQYPAALLVLAGDNDLHTFAQRGHNPGRDKATAAARAVHGLAVFPEGLPDGGTDFNDLHQHIGGADGLQAVCRIVEAVIDAHSASKAAALTGKAGSSRTKPPHEASGADGDTGRAFEPFTVDDTGIWFTGADQDGKRKPPEWVCSRLDVEALTRDQDGGGWGYLLAFDDPLGNPKQWAMQPACYRAMVANTEPPC